MSVEKTKNSASLAAPSGAGSSALVSATPPGTPQAVSLNASCCWHWYSYLVPLGTVPEATVESRPISTLRMCTTGELTLT